MHGPTSTFWGNLTPLSLQRSYIFARRAPIELAIAAKAADTDVAVIPLVDPHGEGERGAPRWEYELEPEAAAADGAKAVSEKDAVSAQKLGQLRPFVDVFPQENMGQLVYFGPT